MMQIATLSSLKDFKFNKSRSNKNGTKNSFSSKLDQFALPPEFRCPISTHGLLYKDSHGLFIFY
jgi:hypothetical protein